LPCSGDVSAFSSTSVSFPDDELQYVTVSGYVNVHPVENGVQTLGELKVFPKALSLHNSPSLGIDAQFHANEFRTILERFQQSGGIIKPVQILFVGNGIGWSPESQALTLFMGRVWRDLGLHALVLANYAAGYSDLNIIHERVWGKMSSSLRSLLGISSVHNTINTVLTKLEEVWSSCDKIQGANIEHLEADSYWYQDLSLVQEFFSSWNSKGGEGDDHDDFSDGEYQMLADEWRFLAKHLDRRFNMICFRRCNEGELCDHCQALGPVAAPNVWKILSANDGRFFSPSWSHNSLKQNYVFRSFLEEIEADVHEKPDAVLPSRHGELEKLLCGLDGCGYLCTSSVQLVRHYEVLHPESSLQAPEICRFPDSSGKLCGLVFESKNGLEAHRKETGHTSASASSKRGRPRKKSLDQPM
jgi:hypothetical protein